MLTIWICYLEQNAIHTDELQLLWSQGTFQVSLSLEEASSFDNLQEWDVTGIRIWLSKIEVPRDVRNSVVWDLSGSRVFNVRVS